LPWKQIAVERFVKTRGETALSETFEQKLSVQRQLPTMCRHIPIEKIRCFDQDCAKQKEHLALSPPIRCLPYPVRGRIGCCNKLVSPIQIDDLVSGCPGDGHHKKKPNQQSEGTAFAHSHHKIGQHQLVCRPVPRSDRDPLVIWDIFTCEE